MHDEATPGLKYNNQRMYHTQLGRFITTDPWMANPFRPSPGDGYPDGPNAYAGYHILHGGVDPTGLSTFQIEQNFGLLASYNMDKALETAEDSGYFFDRVDNNDAAEEHQILDHLANMGGSDMWVYIGHANDNALSEYDYFSPNEPISNEDLMDAMRNKGTRTAPGIVVLAGCKTCGLAQMFLDAGSKCVVCFEHPIGGPSAAEFAENFVMRMFETGRNHRGLQWSIRQAFDNAVNQQTSWMYAGGEDVPVKLKCRKNAYYNMHFGRISAMPVDESRYK